MSEAPRPAPPRRDAVSFQAHVELLQAFLAQRRELVQRVQTLLNAQRKPPQYWRDALFLARQLEDCFFLLPALTTEHRALRSQLDETHWASGFKPRDTHGQPNDLIDAAEMMRRAFHMWQQTRWPGERGRVHYAEVLFNVYLLRRLLLALRIWDSGAAGAGERLAQVQGLLDQVWRTAPADQPVLVRDARWLFGLALSPTTDELHGYFEVAERIEATLSQDDRLEIASANVRMAGGHLRSQLRHVATQKGVSLDDHDLVLSTRRSNALDLATLIQSLVPLLAAYEHADGDRRLALADAILQGVSPDPELFLNRLELLGPYSMIEYLFVARDADGRARYTPMGQRHLRLLDDYRALIARLANRLRDDSPNFRPAPGAYSPYGALYGFSSQLLEHIALKASQPDAVTRFSVEDALTRGDAGKLAWVSGWRKLPHVPHPVAKLFEYPERFADDAFARIERALEAHASSQEASAAARTGGLCIADADAARAARMPLLAIRHVVSSDRQVVAANRAVPCDPEQLLRSRTEGEFLISYPTSAGWIAISKDVLTDVVGAARYATIVGLPTDAAEALVLLCPELIVPVEPARPLL